MRENDDVDPGATDEFLNTMEAAQFLGRSASTLEGWRVRKIGPKYARSMGRIFYKRADLEDFKRPVVVDPAGSDAR